MTQQPDTDYRSHGDRHVTRTRHTDTWHEHVTQTSDTWHEHVTQTRDTNTSHRIAHVQIRNTTRGSKHDMAVILLPTCRRNQLKQLEWWVRWSGENVYTKALCYKPCATQQILYIIALRSAVISMPYPYPSSSNQCSVSLDNYPSSHVQCPYSSWRMPFPHRNVPLS